MFNRFNFWKANNILCLLSFNRSFPQMAFAVNPYVRFNASLVISMEKPFLQCITRGSTVHPFSTVNGGVIASSVGWMNHFSAQLRQLGLLT
jgi:hypothetical protein